MAPPAPRSARCREPATASRADSAVVDDAPGAGAWSTATCCSRRRLTRPRLSASANEPPIRPQPITPSCWNIRPALPPPLVDPRAGGVSDRRRIGAQQLRRRRRRAVRAARRRCAGSSGWPEVDVEVIPTGPERGRPRLEARHRHAVRLQRHQQLQSQARPVDRPRRRGWCSRGRGARRGWRSRVTMAKRVAVRVVLIAGASTHAAELAGCARVLAMAGQRRGPAPPGARLRHF